MAEKTTGEHEVQEMPGVATLLIPEDLAQQVVDYLAALDAGDTDVSGYMFKLGSGGLAATTQSTATNCHTTGISPSVPNGDMLCDTDQLIVN